MNYQFLPENAVRQFIDSSTVCVELARARQQAQTWAGSMYWKQQDIYSYLVTVLNMQGLEYSKNFIKN